MLSLRQPKIVKCVTSVCLIDAMRSECDFFGNIITLAKNIRGILCLSFFLVLIFHWLTTWGCANGGALLFQPNTKCDITRTVRCSAFQCHNRAANKWSKKVNVISTSNCVFTRYYIGVNICDMRTLWKTFSTNVSLFRHLFCVVLTFGKFRPITHHFWS